MINAPLGLNNVWFSRTKARQRSHTSATTARTHVYHGDPFAGEHTSRRLMDAAA